MGDSRLYQALILERQRERVFGARSGEHVTRYYDRGDEWVSCFRSRILACNSDTSCNTLTLITLKDYPFKELEHEKTTNLGSHYLHQPAIDGC
jgi:hypothetical protein